MMSRRSNQAERGFRFANDHSVDGIASRPGGEQCNVVRMRADDGVGIGLAATPGGHRGNAIDVSGNVHSLDALTRRGLQWADHNWPQRPSVRALL